MNWQIGADKQFIIQDLELSPLQDKSISFPKDACNPIDKFSWKIFY